MGTLYCRRSSKPQSIAQKGKKRKWEVSLAATSDNVIDELKFLNQNMAKMNSVSMEHDKNQLKQEKMQPAKEYYVTTKDAPEEYRAILNERMELIVLCGVGLWYLVFSMFIFLQQFPFSFYINFNNCRHGCGYCQYTHALLFSVDVV
jgi:hypothetical protein